jgi:hypothetical protein
MGEIAYVVTGAKMQLEELVGGGCPEGLQFVTNFMTVRLPGGDGFVCTKVIPSRRPHRFAEMLAT